MAPNRAPTPRLGKLPEDVSCPNSYCGEGVRTVVKKEFSTSGWIAVGILVLVMVLFCWVPFVLDGFYDFTHRCPNCNAVIGKSTPDDREEEKNKAIKTCVITVVATYLTGIALAIIIPLIFFGVTAAAFVG